PLLVIRSLPLAPVSLARATPGATGALVSRVKVRLPAELVLPARSVCRTRTLLVPSTAVKLAVQVVPPSMEYSITAPASMPVRDRVPVLVIRSLLLVPVSLDSTTPGGVGATVSRVKVRLPAELVL